MLVRLLDFFRTGPDRPLFSEEPERIRRRYEAKRWSVFLSVTLGYGVFYVGRINFSVEKEPLLEAGILSTTEMGFIGSAMLVGYALGRLVNGFLADRANIRRFLSSGLLLSALVNLALGGSTGFWLFFFLWGLNGWFQAAGSGPCVVSLSHWFSKSERGTRYGIWSIAHSIGEGLTFAVTAVLVATWGWRAGFLGPGLLCLAGALVLFRTLADRPQTYGLPDVATYRKDPNDAPAGHQSTGQLQLLALKTPGVWILGLASASMYVARYGVNNWGMLYLQEAKSYSILEAGSVLTANTVAGLLGAASSGWLSDRFFGSRRNLPALLYGLGELAGLAGLFLVPAGHPLLDTAAMCLFGFALGGLLVFLGGLMAVDLVPRQAAGAAMGVVGLFSYLGAALQDSVSGYLLDRGRTLVDGVTHYDFGPAALFWVGASLLSILLTAGVWRAKSSSLDQGPGDDEETSPCST